MKTEHVPLSYTETYAVRTYEIDRRKQMTVPALVRLMQEAAMQHVIGLKLSVWDLEPMHLSWVLLHKHVEVIRMPRLGERITIFTCPSGFERMFTFRDYKVFGEDGRLLAWSSSKWLLMNNRTRRMSPLPSFILALGADLPEEASFLPRPGDKLSPPAEPAYRKSFQVNWHDLDFNGHLNNTIYIYYMLEALPGEVLDAGYPETLDVQYRQEGHLGDHLLSEAEALGDGRYLHRLVRQPEGKELALAFSKWRLPSGAKS